MLHENISPYSVEDLEKFRNEDGFVDLNKAGVSFSADSRETMGNANRFKNWISFGDTSFLVKEELNLNGQSASVYAELIIEELAKQVGIDCAHNDLIVYDNFRGIMSQNIVGENEQMFSIDSLIGPTKTYPDYPEQSDLLEVQIKLIKALHTEGYSKKEIKSVISSFQKYLVFSLFTLLTDGHLENLSCIQSEDPETHKKSIKMAPLYDFENGFLLDYDMELLQELAVNPDVLNPSCDTAFPKVAALDTEKQDDILINTVNALLNVDENYDFAILCCEQLDIKEAISAVEKRTHSKLPPEVVSVTTKAFSYRKDFIDKVMSLEIDNDVIPDSIDPKELDDEDLEL